MTGQVDLERRLSDWLRAEAPARASDDVLAATLDRVAVLGQERALPRWSHGHRSGSSRLTLIAATVALLILLVATAVLIGGQLVDEVLPRPSALVVPTTVPVPSFVPTAPPFPARIPTTTAHAGSAATDIGQVSWTALDGDASNLPSGQIFDTPDGFAAIEPGLDGASSRFWTSSDGLEWTVGAMPVPAEGVVGHSLADGEHWIWSGRDLRLWRSADFVTWTEVDLAGLRPPAIGGVRWTFYPTKPATIGSTSVVTWNVWGSLALDELLGIEPEPGTSLMVGSSRDYGELGEVRPVSRVDATVNGPGESRTVVGTIRVTLDGDVVTITDADRDTVVAEIDARLAGAPAAALAKGLSEEGFFRAGGGGAVITGSAATATAIAPDVTDLVPIDGGFIALENDFQNAPSVWASTDGLEWTSLGPAITPSSSPPNTFYLAPRPDTSDLDAPLIAIATVDVAGSQREEIWSSTDGLRWESVGVTFSDPGTRRIAIPAPAGGYVAIGDDHALYVSAAGARWTAVDGIDDLQTTIDEVGGMTNYWTTRDRVLMVEVTLTGQRRLWILQVAPGG